LFEDNTLPTADEQQLFTWKDATLREVLTTLRDAAPSSTEFRHPLARYAFRAIYADSANRGRFAQKDLGIVYSRDILGEPGNLTTTAARLLEDVDGENRELSEREKEERTLEELRFVPGDYLCVSILLPKNLTVPIGPTGDVALKPTTATVAATTNGWRIQGSGRVDGGWGASIAPGVPGTGRGGGHWRGDSNPPPPGVGSSGVSRGGRGGGGIGRGDFANRDRDFDGMRGNDRRVPPPRRESPPHRGYGERDRGGKGEKRSRSRSRTPPRLRRRFG